MKQMHHLGEFVRRRYGEFLGNVSTKDIYARSTDYIRTVQCLQSVLAKILPSDEEENAEDSRKNAEIQDFTVQVTPLKKDVLFRTPICDM